MSRYCLCVVTLVLLGGSMLGCSSNSSSSSSAQEADVPLVSKPVPPDSPFAKVKVGMASDEVFATIGRPTSEDTYQTGKAFIPQEPHQQRQGENIPRSLVGAVPVARSSFLRLGATILGLTGQSGESRRQKALFYRLLHGLFTTSGGGSGVILFQVRFV